MLHNDRMFLIARSIAVASLLNLFAIAGLASGQAAAPAAAPHVERPTPPTRDPHTPGYVAARELPDGANAPAKEDGNFIIGPTHNRAPEMIVHDGVPRGAVFNLIMKS